MPCIGFMEVFLIPWPHLGQGFLLQMTQLQKNSKLEPQD